VTIAVVPRETLSQVRDALEDLVANTAPPYRLVIVDADYPAATRRWLAGFAETHDALVLRAGCTITPNRARNAALAWVDTEFVVFLDDNCFVRKGWLDALLQCADETGAGLVAPLYGFRASRDGAETVHAYSGNAHVEVVSGRRVVDDTPHHCGMTLDQALRELHRTRTETGEFHCLLVRTAVFEGIGWLDEGLLCMCEHLDLCMLAREAGHEIWADPAAVAMFERPIPIPWGDRMFYVFRWSEQLNEPTMARFSEKWDLDLELTTERFDSFVAYSRRLAYHLGHKFPDRVFQKLTRPALGTIDRLADRAVAGYQRRRARSRGITVAHPARWAGDPLPPRAPATSRPAQPRASARTG
jgi:hypothetical protein